VAEVLDVYCQVSVRGLILINILFSLAKGVQRRRDIELFNLSSLARQVCRVLENPKTRSARILKVVYYPILEAQLGSHPSIKI
jgi:hypothetical protein